MQVPSNIFLNDIGRPSLVSSLVSEKELGISSLANEGLGHPDLANKRYSRG